MKLPQLVLALSIFACGISAQGLTSTYYATINKTVTLTQWRSTVYVATTATPTSIVSCRPAWTTEGGDPFVRAKAEQNNFESGVAKKVDVVTSTLTSTVLTKVSTDVVRTKTIAKGCEPTNVKLSSSLDFGDTACGDAFDVQQTQYCGAAFKRSWNAYTVEPADCCSQCKNTLNCHSATSEPESNICAMLVITAMGNNTDAPGPTAECPIGRGRTRLGSSWNGLTDDQGNLAWRGGILNGPCGVEQPRCAALGPGP
ncbi:hypothetical protein G7Y89_g6039 [Cudoniella acicularis]|uniref:Apple domain-containing protein n=1 Tax=Cudoniella acicularis TaxID=354080 RepID=A0A8H4RNH8_9HELO|nr:hypothetical protein G7Y89_g6039 [Cudoniella acicularis]